MRVGAARPHLGRYPDRLHQLLFVGSLADGVSSDDQAIGDQPSVVVVPRVDAEEASELVVSADVVSGKDVKPAEAGGAARTPRSRSRSRATIARAVSTTVRAFVS
jgi:hypothetical protein